MRRTIARPAFAVLAAAVALTLAACSSSSDEATEDETTAAETTAAEETEAAEETTEAEETTDAAADATDVATCILGTWEQDPAADTGMSAEDLGGTSTIDVTGTSTVTFDATTVTYDVDTSGTVSTDLGENGGLIEVSTVAKGTAVQGYTLADSLLTWGAEVSSDGTFTVDSTTNGVTTSSDVPFGTAVIKQEGLTAEVQCSGDELSMVMNLAELGSVDITTVLTRVG